MARITLSGTPAFFSSFDPDWAGLEGASRRLDLGNDNLRPDPCFDRAYYVAIRDRASCFRLGGSGFGLICNPFLDFVSAGAEQESNMLLFLEATVAPKSMLIGHYERMRVPKW